jgi:hypothetical protein
MHYLSPQFTANPTAANTANPTANTPSSFPTNKGC